MNDEFLKQYRKPPRQAFVRSLTQRFTHPERKAENMVSPLKRPIALGSIALLVALALLLVTSPGARAQMLDWVRQIGGISFSESGDYPGGPESEVTIVPSEVLSLEQARVALPFEIVLPSYIPEGYVFDGSVTVTRFPSQVITTSMYWESPNPGNPIFLNIQYRGDGLPWNQLVGEGSAEEVRVNGQPAGLVRGVWNYDTKRWDDANQLSLFWSRADTTYVLQARSTAVSVEELVRIAESVE